MRERLPGDEAPAAPDRLRERGGDRVQGAARLGAQLGGHALVKGAAHVAAIVWNHVSSLDLAHLGSEPGRLGGLAAVAQGPGWGGWPRMRWV